MASVTDASRPPIGLTVVALIALVLVAILIGQWLVGLVLGLIRLVLILFALYLMARVGLWLLRKGGSGNRTAA
ncbi:MAG: hypothetical protein AAF547_24070 [Actinomycetota bacterium]